MALSDPIRYHLAGEVHELGSRGINARHPLFGARGDYDPVTGTGTDDTAALQAWLNHAQDIYRALESGYRHSEQWPPPPQDPNNPPPADYTGVVCILPAGNYKVSGTLTLECPLRLQGAGWNEAVIHATTNAPILRVVRRVHAAQPRAVVRGIGFEGTHVKFSYNGGRENQHGIIVEKDPEVDFNAHVDVEDCSFYGLGGAGIHGWFFESDSPDAAGDKFRIRGNHISVCGDFGIKLSGRHATAYISGNHIHDCAGGIGLLGQAATPPPNALPLLPVSTAVIEGNIIEANVTGYGPPGSAANPAVGILLKHVFIARIERNYFEWHLNGIYLTEACSGVQIVRNHFDGNDVYLPERHALATGTPIGRQLSPVYWDGSTHSDVLVKENDVYVPVKPASTDPAVWTPPPATWGATYEVFPSIHGYAHQLIRNAARIAGGMVQDATYKAGSEGTMYYESVAPIPGAGGPLGVQLRQIAGRYQHESSDALAGVYHDFIFPAALTDAARVRHALWARNANGSLTLKRVVSSIGDAGWSFYGDVQMHGSVFGNGWRTLAQVSKNPGAATLSYSNLAVAPVVAGSASSADDAAGPLLLTATAATLNATAGVTSGNYAVVLAGWLPDFTTTLMLGQALNTRVWAGLFSADPAASATPAGVRIAAFRYDTVADGTAFWRCVTSDGTSQTVTTTSVAVAANQRYQLRVRFVDGGTAEFYINGTHVATHATNMPGSNLLGFANRVTALTATVRDIRTGRIAVSHNS